MTLREQAKTKTVDELIRGAFFLSKILGSAYRDELQMRFGFELSEADIKSMKAALDQFDADHMEQE